jgi:uncharacterized protein (TIGR02266 family)
MACILLVDDLVPLLDLHRAYLRRTTCRVITARTGAEALAICRHDRPDLVFLDASLPGMDGIEACRALKQDDALRGIPVVLLAPADRDVECRGAGCEAVLAKPVSRDAFLEQVRRFVRLLERQDSRIPASLRVSFAAGWRTGSAFTRDVSPGGLFLKTARPFAPGTRLSLSIALPSGAVRAEGEVRRLVEKSAGSGLIPGIGVRFLDPPPETSRALEAFIAARLAAIRT